MGQIHFPVFSFSSVFPGIRNNPQALQLPTSHLCPHCFPRTHTNTYWNQNKGCLLTMGQQRENQHYSLFQG